MQWANGFEGILFESLIAYLLVGLHRITNKWAVLCRGYLGFYDSTVTIFFSLLYFSSLMFSILFLYFISITMSS